MLRTQPRTELQKTIVEQMVKTFGIDGSKILFFPENPTEPWMPGKMLAKIARLSGKFRVMRVDHERTMEVGRDTQLHSQGIVVDLHDITYSLPGMATVGEKIPETEDAANPWDLADARALRSTLALAGFDPVDPTSVVALNGNGNQQPAPRNLEAAETLARLSDNARIHILAKEKDLIVGKDFSKYRKFLAERYEGAISVAGFDATMRKSVIAALEQYTPPFDPAAMPEEFAELETEGAAVS